MVLGNTYFNSEILKVLYNLHYKKKKIAQKSMIYKSNK